MNPWNNDNIQFPRLITEIASIPLASAQIAELCNHMDITKEELCELFDRAYIAFEQSKTIYLKGNKS